MFDRGLWAYDIETLSNCFTYTGLNIDTQQVVQYVIHESRDNSKELFEHLKECKGHIGFNNINFDYPVVHYFISKLGVTAEELYIKSQSIIGAESVWINNVPHWKWYIDQLDLYKIMHYDNKARATSLKWVEYSINLAKIQDMPINHADKVYDYQIDEILEYNLNDVKATYELYKIVKGQTDLVLYKGIDKIALRQDIIAEFGGNKSWLNYNDVKLGDEINKITYLKLKGIDKKDFKKSNTQRSSLLVKDCIEPYIEFKTPEFKEFFNRFKEIVFNPKELPESDNSIKYKYLNISFGFGGLHTVDSRRNIQIQSNEELIDADVTSYYPNTIIQRELYPEHLGVEWLEGYKWVYDRRVEAKKLSKTDRKYQSINEAYKLALNGAGFGKLNEYTSWTYDPLQAFKVTINNQFALLMLCEQMILAGIFVVSLNTDGILCIVKNDQRDIYNTICKEWEVIVKHTLEYTFYKKFIQTSVNDYIAQTIDGKTKYKGDFEIDKELHKNKSNTVRAIALQQYYLYNKGVTDTITNHTNIFDFTIGRKKTHSQVYRYYYASEFELKYIDYTDKVIRYYVSTDGGKLQKIDGKRITKQEQDYRVTMFMEYKKLDNYNIDYEYYINETRKIINSIDVFIVDDYLSKFKNYTQLKMF